MQFTDSEIQEILRENQQLKKDLDEAREELEATNRLYDTMVVGTRNLLLLTEEGSFSSLTKNPWSGQGSLKPGIISFSVWGFYSPFMHLPYRS